MSDIIECDTKEEADALAAKIDAAIAGSPEGWGETVNVGGGRHAPEKSRTLTHNRPVQHPKTGAWAYPIDAKAAQHLDAEESAKITTKTTDWTPRYAVDGSIKETDEREPK